MSVIDLPVSNDLENNSVEQEASEYKTEETVVEHPVDRSPKPLNLQLTISSKLNILNRQHAFD